MVFQVGHRLLYMTLEHDKCQNSTLTINSVLTAMKNILHAWDCVTEV